MLYASQEDAIAHNYFSFVNDVIGILALTLAATALQFDKPQPFAWSFFIVVFVWVFSKGADSGYRAIARRYAERFKGMLGFVYLGWRLNIFLVGFTSLFLVAAGVITKEGVYHWFGFLT